MIWYNKIVEYLNILFEQSNSEQKVMDILIQLNNIHEISSIYKYINEIIFWISNKELE